MSVAGEGGVSVLLCAGGWGLLYSKGENGRGGEGMYFDNSFAFSVSSSFGDWEICYVAG